MRRPRTNTTRHGPKWHPHPPTPQKPGLGDIIGVAGVPVPMMIKAIGRSGVKADDDLGVRRSIRHAHITGVLERHRPSYTIEDEGEDGAVLLDTVTGQREFAPHGKYRVLQKAAQHPTDARFDGVRRKLTANQSYKAELLGEPESQIQPAKYKHGDWVRYQFGQVQNVGRIVSSGGDGVTLALVDGREVKVPHGQIVGKAQDPRSEKEQDAEWIAAKAMNLTLADIPVLTIEAESALSPRAVRRYVSLLHAVMP